MSRIIVTGGRGFVGRRLVKRLQEAGCEVEVFDREEGYLGAGRFEAVPADRVIHLAARVFVPESWSSPLDFYRTNVCGVVAVLEYCARLRCPLTFISSYVYGVPQRLPVDEEHPLQAFNPYAHTKIAAEQACRLFAARFDFPLTILRPFNLYGAGQRGEFLIPEIARQALDPSRPAITLQDLAPKRDFVYVDDLVDALELTLDGEPGTYNVGSGTSVSAGDLARMFCRAAGIDKPVGDREQRRKNEVMDVRADIARIREKLGWTPRTTLDQGLAKVAAYDKQHGFGDVQTQ